MTKGAGVLTVLLIGLGATLGGWLLPRASPLRAETVRIVAVADSIIGDGTYVVGADDDRGGLDSVRIDRRS